MERDNVRHRYEVAEGLLGEARRLAAEVRRDAEREADLLRRDAQRWADERRREADLYHAQASALLDVARERARELIDDAEREAARIRQRPSRDGVATTTVPVPAPSRPEAGESSRRFEVPVRDEVGGAHRRRSPDVVDLRDPVDAGPAAAGAAPAAGARPDPGPGRDEEVVVDLRDEAVVLDLRHDDPVVDLGIGGDVVDLRHRRRGADLDDGTVDDTIDQARRSRPADEVRPRPDPPEPRGFDTHLREAVIKAVHRTFY